jgi:Topoisomerase DNA binding C4 zinc finger
MKEPQVVSHWNYKGMKCHSSPGSIRSKKWIGYVAVAIMIGPLWLLLLGGLYNGEISATGKGLGTILLIMVPTLILWLSARSDHKDMNAIENFVEEKAKGGDPEKPKVQGSYTLVYPDEPDKPKRATAQASRKSDPKKSIHSSISIENCQRCGSPMAVRTNRKTQTKFLGCTSFPRCRHTRSMRSVA